MRTSATSIRPQEKETRIVEICGNLGANRNEPSRDGSLREEAKLRKSSVSTRHFRVGRQPDTADSDRITTSFEILYTAEGGRHDSPLPPPRFGSGELANRSRLRGRYRAKGASNAIERDTGGEDPWIAAGERAGKIRAAREGGVEGVGI